VNKQKVKNKGGTLLLQTSQYSNWDAMGWTTA